MASNISTTNIDETYPVAGQDNDSQGFRDNFSQIKTQLGTASTEITAIQTNQAVTNADTDFNGHDQSELVLKDWGQKIVAKGTVTGSIACSFADGNVVTLTTSGNVSLTFSNFPVEDDTSTNVYSSMRVLLTKANSTHTVTLTGVSFPNDPDQDVGDSSTVSTTFAERQATFVFDIFSVDGGTTKYISNILEYPSSS
jgi:hypothetical protein|tara:strand:- start:119 stop:709 length:591 start_codon:yes stop_codon:yes gene_type:complete